MLAFGNVVEIDLNQVTGNIGLTCCCSQTTLRGDNKCSVPNRLIVVNGVTVCFNRQIPKSAPTAETGSCYILDAFRTVSFEPFMSGSVLQHVTIFIIGIRGHAAIDIGKILPLKRFNRLRPVSVCVSILLSREECNISNINGTVVREKVIARICEVIGSHFLLLCIQQIDNHVMPLAVVDVVKAYRVPAFPTAIGTNKDLSLCVRSGCAILNQSNHARVNGGLPIRSISHGNQSNIRITSCCFQGNILAVFAQRHFGILHMRKTFFSTLCGNHIRGHQVIGGTGDGYLGVRLHFDRINVNQCSSADHTDIGSGSCANKRICDFNRLAVGIGEGCLFCKLRFGYGCNVLISLCAFQFDRGHKRLTGVNIDGVIVVEEADNIAFNRELVSLSLNSGDSFRIKALNQQCQFSVVDSDTDTGTTGTVCAVSLVVVVDREFSTVGCGQCNGVDDFFAANECIACIAASINGVNGKHILTVHCCVVIADTVQLIHLVTVEFLYFAGAVAIGRQFHGKETRQIGIIEGFVNVLCRNIRDKSLAVITHFSLGRGFFSGLLFGCLLRGGCLLRNGCFFRNSCFLRFGRLLCFGCFPTCGSALGRFSHSGPFLFVCRCCARCLCRILVVITSNQRYEQCKNKHCNNYKSLHGSFLSVVIFS
ncbi:unknown [Clostridium sp. CAG:448]|nr:unknown [Clostridium sp. CAG:448]